MDNIRRTVEHQITVADTCAGLPASGAIAFEIWKARYDLPLPADFSDAEVGAVPTVGDADAAAPRQGTASPVPSVPLPALDGLPDAWL